MLFRLLRNERFVNRLDSVEGVIGLWSVFLLLALQAHYLLIPVPPHLSISVFFVAMWLVFFRLSRSLLNNSVFRFWGRVSYSAYVIHFLVVRSVFEGLGGDGSEKFYFGPDSGSRYNRAISTSRVPVH